MSINLTADQKAALVESCLCPLTEKWVDAVSGISNADFKTLQDTIDNFMQATGDNKPNQHELAQLDSRCTILQQLKIPREVVAGLSTIPSFEDFLVSIHGGATTVACGDLLNAAETSIQADLDWGMSITEEESVEGGSASLISQRYGADSVEERMDADDGLVLQAENRATYRTDPSRWAMDRLKHSYDAASIAVRDEGWRAAMDRVYAQRVWMAAMGRVYPRGGPA